MAGGDDDAAFLDPAIEPLLIDAFGNLECPEGAPSGVRVEPCVDTVQDGAISLRVLPGPGVEGRRRLAPAQIFLIQGRARGSPYQEFEVQPVPQIQMLCTMASWSFVVRFISGDGTGPIQLLGEDESGHLMRERGVGK